MQVYCITFLLGKALHVISWQKPTFYNLVLAIHDFLNITKASQNASALGFSQIKLFLSTDTLSSPSGVCCRLKISQPLALYPLPFPKTALWVLSSPWILSPTALPCGLSSLEPFAPSLSICSQVYFHRGLCFICLLHASQRISSPGFVELCVEALMGLHA